MATTRSTTPARKTTPRTPSRSSSRAPRRPRPPADSAPLSPEILWYLKTRGYEVPSVVPLIRTPEPRHVKGAVFHPERVDRAIKALQTLRHTKGKWAGKPLDPAPVQVAYIIAPVFGWCAPDSSGDLVRIIRDAYIEMPRKGAKTTLVSGLATYLAFADREPGAEVVMGAASRDQAGNAFKPVKAICQSSAVLRRAGIKPMRTEITQERTQSFIKAVSSRGDLAHGANVHGGLVDELHVHKSPDLLEAIESGTGARAQPLVFIITTADDGSTTSVYAQRRHMIEQIAKKVITAATMYGVVFAATERDDPFAEATWAKANPLYPVTPSPEFMRSAADKAQTSAPAKASFLRLHLGIRSKLVAAFFDLPRWDRNAGDPKDVTDAALAGRAAYGGLDLASTSDINALVWLFPDADSDRYDVLCRFWVPEDALPALDTKTHNSASGWVRDGWLSTTPGDVTDYDFIKAQVRTDLEQFDVQALGFDRWNSTQLVIDLQAEGAPVERVGQGTASLSAPLKNINRLYRRGTLAEPLLRHGGNPVLRWMADNTRVTSDAAENIKPDKAKSMDKIDGISAMTTAMYVAMNAEPPGSSYDDFDFMVLGGSPD